MRFELSEEEQAVRDLARGFARDICGPGAAERDKNEEFPKEPIRKAAALGLMGLLVPEEFGGAGLGALAREGQTVTTNVVDTLLVDGYVAA